MDEELRKVAIVRLALYQQKLRQGFEKMVKVRTFIPGDLVLRKVVGSVRNLSWGKLGPNWEGLYLVTSVTRVGGYRLKDLDGLVVPRMWNVLLGLPTLGKLTFRLFYVKQNLGQV